MISKEEVDKFIQHLTQPEVVTQNDFGTWDKKLSIKLRSLGITDQEVIGAIIGEVAEQRQAADYFGYKRGFENGISKGRSNN